MSTVRPPIIDSQVHAYERDRPERPWAGTLVGPSEVNGDQMVAAMDAVGVDGALLVSPYSMYRYDGSYALEVQAAHPGRFGLIKPFDPQADDVAEQVAEWAAKPGVVGARIMLDRSEADDEGLDRLVTAAKDHELPVNLLCGGSLSRFGELAFRNPDAQLVVDHLGLRQPFDAPPPDEPFADLPNVLALAKFDNVAIKISGACTLSKQSFPFDDIWEPLARIFEAFGIERCLWGTDWTRAVNLLTYDQGVEAFRRNDHLSDTDRAALMGGSLTRIYRWSPTGR
ncbi:MAG: amidohydrolase family protein [Gammaproteobacteria bacterium]